MPYERAFMLATMPRKKWSENTWAAFWAALAALPGAAEAIHSGVGKTPFQLGAFEMVQVVVFVGFFVWFVVSRLTFREKTATEYLNELYSLPSIGTKRWWQFWR